MQKVVFSGYTDKFGFGILMAEFPCSGIAAIKIEVANFSPDALFRARAAAIVKSARKLFGKVEIVKPASFRFKS